MGRNCPDSAKSTFLRNLIEFGVGWVYCAPVGRIMVLFGWMCSSTRFHSEHTSIHRHNLAKKVLLLQ